MDISNIELRGMFSPPNKKEPQLIPDYWKETPTSLPVTNLPDLTDEELNSLGWKGPIQTPPLPGTSYLTHKFIWNQSTREYEAIELSDYEKRLSVNYQYFWDKLLDSLAYAKIKSESVQSLATNTIVTEFIALISDAKQGKPNVEKIQSSLLEILSAISFTDDELSEINLILTESNMLSIYSLS